MNEQPLPDIAAQATHHDLPLDWVGMAGIALPIRLADAAVTANDVFTICWTSGTESEPKGVPRAHLEWLAICRATVQPSVAPTSTSLSAGTSRVRSRMTRISDARSTCTSSGTARRPKSAPVTSGRRRLLTPPGRC